MTTAVVDTPFFTIEEMNYDKGFSNFIYVRGQRNVLATPNSERRDINLLRLYETDWCAPNTLLTASRWLERHYKESFFLYVDTWDPHEPWDPPPWYVEYYYPEYDGTYDLLPYWFYKEAGLTDEEVKKDHVLYCGEITMVDRWVGHLIDTIESLNIMNETAIVFTSDHGFYFGEHGMYGKTLTPKPHHFKTLKNKPALGRYRSPLYEEITHVPLLIYLPRVKARRIDDIAGLADLMPTVLELMGVKIPKSVQAQSLVPLWSGEDREKYNFSVTSPALNSPAETTREVDNIAKKIIEWPLTTITTQEWSLLYAVESQPAELYHLSSDPRQDKNLIKERPEVAQDLLNKFVKQMEEAGTEAHRINPRRRF